MFRPMLRGSHPKDLAPIGEPPPPNPEHAWKALSLVNDWIRHSDTKAGVTLAFTGALGAMLFNLTRDANCRTFLFDIVVVAGCSLLVVTAALCAWTLTPRVNDRDAAPDSINRLFFKSISHHFEGDRLRYAEVLGTLTSDAHELINDLAHQIHANAKIATVKAKYAQWAIWSAMAAGAFVATTALIVGIDSL